MITLNGVHFAANDKEFVGSLFTAGSTASGYYKAYKNTVNLLDHNKVKVGVINKYGVLALATQPDGIKGKWWYSYGDIPLIGEYTSIAQKNDEVKQALTFLKH